MKQHINELILVLLVFISGASAETLYVNETGWHHSGGAFNATDVPIQHGINNATSGDTVYVWNGSYTENVDISTSSLTLEGEGSGVVIVSAGSSSDHVIHINNDYVNVSGFNVTGATTSSKSGICTQLSDGCTISDCITHSNSHGCVVEDVSNSSFTDIVVHDNNLYGFDVENSTHNVFEGVVLHNTTQHGMYFHTGANFNDLTNITIYNHDNSYYGVNFYYVNNNTINDSHFYDFPAGSLFSIYALHADHTTVDNCTVHDCQTGIYFSHSSNLVITDNDIQDCFGSPSLPSDCGISVINDASYCIINNNTVINTTKVGGGGGNCIWVGWGTYNHHITIDNNTCGNCGHNCIDIHENFHDITVSNNTVYNPDNNNGIFMVDGQNNYANKIIDNIVYDVPGYGILAGDSSHTEIKRNTVYDTDYGISTVHDTYWDDSYTSNYQTISDNVLYSIVTMGIYISRSEHNLIENNSVVCTGHDYYITTNSTNNTVRNMAVDTNNIRIANTNNVELDVEFTDGRIFTENAAETGHWYPDRSNLTLGGTMQTVTLTSYNVTALPTSGYLHTPSMNHESDVADDRTNITIDSSVSDNPSWINATMQNASANYSVSVDGAIVSYVDADADAIVRHQYTSLWSSHDFEFGWVASGDVWAPSNQGIYWNSTNPIEITRNATINLFSRTPTQSDNNATTSFSIMVTTT